MSEQDEMEFILEDIRNLWSQQLETQQTNAFQDNLCYLDIPNIPNIFRTNRNPFSKHLQKFQQQIYKHYQSQKHSWMEVWYNSHLQKLLLDYCQVQEWQVLMKCNRRLNKQIILLKLSKENLWYFARWKIGKLLDSDLYVKYSSIDEESEHSIDLDRTVIFMESDRLDQQLKLDRVLRSLSFSIGYFQGLNSITAILLHLYEEEEVYWLVRLLLHQINNLQNNPENYSNYMQHIDNLVRQNQPQIYQHLNKNNFNLEYFAMRWVLALFSYDVEPKIVINLWGLIINFGIIMFTSFILHLFEQLRGKILSTHGNQLNDLLKHNLKVTLLQVNMEEVFKKMKCQYQQNIVKTSNKVTLKQVDEILPTDY